MNDPLAKLIAKADSVAESASALVRQSIRDIQGEISVMAKELRLGVVAKDREKVEKMILRRMADLSVKLNELMETQNELAAKAAAKSAGRLTGMEVKYDAKRAEAITALVTPKQGENLAAVFTDQMGAHAIGALRYATVKVMREQAVQGGGMKAMARALEREWLKQAHSSENFQFKDSGGHVWDTRTYMQMNVRTNAMRVYNDCLVDNIAQATGGDLARISRGGDPNCPLCGPWEGVIVSISGKTKGLPTYEQAREAGCFHPNCVHTLEYVDEIADEEEIELQKAHPVNTEEEAADPDAADERKYAIDQDRYRKAGMSAEEARVAVDRDNLAASIRHGLIRDDAREIVDRMTDAQVTALCPNGNPPTFEPTKGTKKNPEPERWNHGSRGGVVHIARNSTLEHILEVTKANEPSKSANAPRGGKQAIPAKIPSTDYTKLGIEDALSKIEAEKGWNIETRVKLPEQTESLLDLAIRRKNIASERKKQFLKADADFKKIKRKFLEDSVEYKTALNTALRLYKKYKKSKNAASDTMAKTMGDQLSAFRSLLPDTESVISIGTVHASLSAVWAKAEPWIKKTVSPSVFPNEKISIQLNKHGRAYQSGHSINIGTKDTFETHVHETMHFIEEFNAHVHERCVEFLKYRTKGEKLVGLKKLTGLNYKPKEKARADRFFNPYCGKDYTNERTGEVIATEILSMGVERLAREPIVFIREDPEYAKFCLATIQGRL